MASSAIHLAVAKEYLKKNPRNYKEKDILAGTLYPDTVENKDVTHYTDSNRGKDNLSHLQGKVNLYGFLKEHEVSDEFTIGWFLHLVTDYLFFDELFKEEYLLNTSYQDFCKDLYHAYDCLTLYVEEKYHIIDSDYAAYPSEQYTGSPYEKCILDKDEIDDFIDRISSINLESYIEKIMHHQKNVKP